MRLHLLRASLVLVPLGCGARTGLWGDDNAGGSGGGGAPSNSTTSETSSGGMGGMGDRCPDGNEGGSGSGGGPILPTSLQAGGYTTCVLENGSIRCWGYNLFGQLGQGHTDTIGDDFSNQKLSEARARAVKDWLVGSLRLDGSRIIVEGRGEREPLPGVNPRGDAVAQQLNRRVEIHKSGG